MARVLNNKNYSIILALFLTGTISRLPFLEKMQSHWDGPQYSIGVIRYSLEQHTPSPPGYPIYIAFGKLFNLFISDPHLSILLVSVLFSGIGAVVFFIVGNRMFNKTVGLIASLLFLSGPTFYFFGISANPYGILPITAAALALIVYDVHNKKQHGILLGVIFAFCIGVRPQDGLFLTPLFLYGILISDSKNKIKTVISVTIGILAWTIPLFYAIGGLDNYFKLMKEYSNTSLPGFSISHFLDVWFIIIKGLFLSFGLGNLFLIYFVKHGHSHLRFPNKWKKLAKNKLFILFSLWILPSLIFNMFVRSDHAGHQMTYLSAFLLLISYSVWRFFNNNPKIFKIIVVLVVAFNLYTFFRDRDPEMKTPYIPQSFHYSEIRKNDIRMKSKVDFVLQKLDPKTTLLVSSEVMWRPYSYHLKSYDLIALNALDNISAPYIYNRYETKNWNFKHSVNKNFSLTIPREIHTVVFVDDDAYVWIRTDNFKRVMFPANGSVTLVSVDKGKILFGYHKISIQQ